MAFSEPRRRWAPLGLAALLIGVLACTAPAPAPTTAPAAQPTTAPAAAKPAETTPAAEAKPAASAAAAPAQAAKKPETPAEIALYKGPDRQQILEEGARKEGSVIFYTGYIVDQVVRPQVAAFEKKYPFIKVDFARTGSEEALQRVRTEYQGGRYEVDLMDGWNNAPNLVEDKISIPFWSPFMDAYPKDAESGADPNGMWVNVALYPRAIAFNTKLVPKDQAPTSWEGLLDPKWKGKIAWSKELTLAQMMIGYWLDTMGEAKGTQFIKDFSKNVVTQAQSTRAVEDQVIAGDFAICPCAVHHTEISKAEGAPVDWFSPGDTVPETTAQINLVKNPRHPYAAMLWVDFMLDPDGGQKVFNELRYIPAHPNYTRAIPGLAGKKAWVLGDRTLQNAPKWQQLLNENFLR